MKQRTLVGGQWCDGQRLGFEPCNTAEWPEQSIKLRRVFYKREQLSVLGGLVNSDDARQQTTDCWPEQQAFTCSQFWSLGSPRSRCQQGWLLVRSLFLACRWSPSRCVLTAFPLCVWAERGKEPALPRPFLQGTDLIVMSTPSSSPHLNLITSQGPTS